MKKENRKMAQQRRAEERRKREQKKKIRKILTYAIPAAIVLALIIAMIVLSKKDSSGTSASDQSTESTENTDSSQSSATGSSDDASAGNDASSNVSYSTDSSLTVKDGDTVNIDFVGSVDGVEFEGGNTQGAGTDLVIGSGSYIDDFEEQLIGAHPGDEVDVTVTFPDPYENNTDLSGKEALFKVTVNGIYE